MISGKDGNCKRCMIKKENIACLPFALQINSTVADNRFDGEEGSSYVFDIWI